MKGSDNMVHSDLNLETYTKLVSPQQRMVPGCTLYDLSGEQVSEVGIGDWNERRERRTNEPFAQMPDRSLGNGFLDGLVDGGDDSHDRLNEGRGDARALVLQDHLEGSLGLRQVRLETWKRRNASVAEEEA